MEWKIQDLEKELANFKKTSILKRDQTSLEEMYSFLESLKPSIKKRLAKHGYGLAVSTHEVFGILAEEMDELNDEVRNNNYELAYNELVDIAVAAMFGMCSVKNYIDKENH